MKWNNHVGYLLDKRVFLQYLNLSLSVKVLGFTVTSMETDDKGE